MPLEELPVLDDDGKATFPVTLSEIPSTTQLLNANVIVRMREAGGRAVERSLTLPVKSEGSMIGIKPEFSGDLAENSVGRFHIIGVSADGAKQAMSGLTWKLIKVERNYQWYRQGNSWRYEPVVFTRQMETGTVSVDANGPALPAAWHVIMAQSGLLWRMAARNLCRTGNFWNISGTSRRNMRRLSCAILSDMAPMCRSFR